MMYSKISALISSLNSLDELAGESTMLFSTGCTEDFSSLKLCLRLSILKAPSLDNSTAFSVNNFSISDSLFFGSGFPFCQPS